MFRKMAFGRRRSENDDHLDAPKWPSTRRRGHSPSPSGGSEQSQEQEFDPTFLPQLSPAPSIANGHTIRRDSESDSGPLGLNVVYTPNNGHKADIVFIHGLGGSSRNTWTKHKDSELFWPLTFLALEPEICLARILTFGYNAAFRKAGNLTTSILDFAKDLLFDLKYAKDAQKEDLCMGTVPLIFVVHSMGGLIVKEAYMQGQNDPEYASIIKATTAIAFLATPHRGTNLAQTLNKILQTTLITNSKQYIAELAKNSFTLQKLNEQFRHVAPKLDIVSFYETRPTPIGLKNTKVMVLERESSVLGYPGETSKGLDADHQGVCKYDGPQDPNYVAVRNILKSLVGKIVASNRSATQTSSSRRSSLDLKAILSITEIPAVDYSFFRDQWARGTCDWVLKEDSYLQWRQVSENAPRVLWLNGGPAAGKSVMASFIINHLAEEGVSCEYFFIRFGDGEKRTLSLLLRSIAYQAAQTRPSLMARINELADEAINFETADSRVIWERIFRSLLFTMRGVQPLFWIIDGLDESQDSRAILKLLPDISNASFPVRILFTSRNAPELKAAFQKVPQSLNVANISISARNSETDFLWYINQELCIAGSAEYKDDIAQRIFMGAQGNFLWVRLAVDKVNKCHRRADVEQALQETPVGMKALYDRMASAINEHTSPVDQRLSSTILHYVTCSLRALTVPELSRALGEDASGIMDFERSIVDLCGGFVVVDNSGNATLIHQTAREYLLGNGQPSQVDRMAAHKQLFLSCMRCLMTPGLRAKINRDPKPEFIDYAATSWSSHITFVPAEDIEVASTLKKFLTGTCILTWIEYLATTKQLRILIRTSKQLSKYIAKRKVAEVGHMEESQSMLDIAFLDSWANDLVKVVGKFGNNLRRSPGSIYRAIPPFCPSSSAIYQIFGRNESSSLLTVSGLSAQRWDDSLARIPVSDNGFASSIAAKGAYISMLVASGNVYTFDSSTFEELPSSPIRHKERLYSFEMSANAALIATYGYVNTKVWQLSTGNCLVSVRNPDSRPRPLAIQFSRDNTQLVVAADDSKIRSVSLSQESPSWELVADLEEPELEGHILNASNFMAINKDSSLIAVAYRGHPLSAWEVDGPIHIGHCWRKRQELARGEVIDAVWHPHEPELFGTYIEGVVFKWRPYDDQIDEIAVGAKRLALTSDGNLCATGDGRGTVRVFTTSSFTLIYQLSTNESVLGITFSPDSLRFYDIRGYYGTVWEPSALREYAEQSSTGVDTDSESQSVANTISMVNFQRVDYITALSASPVGQFYACGTEKGMVRLYHLKTGKTYDLHKVTGTLGTQRITWSDDGRHVAFSDLGKRLVVKSITPGMHDREPDIEDTAAMQLKSTAKGSILKLLFSPNSNLILVQATSSLQVLALKTGEVKKSLQLNTAEYQWITHPKEPSLILGFGPRDIRVFDWDLVEKRVYELTIPLDTSGLQDVEVDSDMVVVDKVLVTLDKRRILAQISRKRRITLLYLDTGLLAADIATEPSTDGTAIKPKVIDPQRSSDVGEVLALLSRNRLVYLSRTFSICTLQLESGAAKEVFSLPGDWISRDCLSLCKIWVREKMFLCPRNGEIGIVNALALA